MTNFAKNNMEKDVIINEKQRRNRENSRRK